VTHDASMEDPTSSENLEARSQELKGTISIATGLLLGPLTVLVFFLILNGLAPRALGTYSFLIGGPLVLALLAARAPMVSRATRQESLLETEREPRLVVRRAR
jgi:hypothetical protein